jgi:hypothetical protein
LRFAFNLFPSIKISYTRMARRKQDLTKLKGRALKRHMEKQIAERGGFFGELLPLKDEPLPKLQTVIERAMREVTKGKSDPALVTILRKQIQKAEAGDTKSAEFLFDRLYGKPMQTIVQHSAPVVTLEHNVIRIDEVKND